MEVALRSSNELPFSAQLLSLFKMQIEINRVACVCVQGGWSAWEEGQQAPGVQAGTRLAVYGAGKLRVTQQERAQGTSVWERGAGDTGARSPCVCLLGSEGKFLS